MSTPHHLAPARTSPQLRSFLVLSKAPLSHGPQLLGLPNLVWHVYSPSSTNQAQVQDQDLISYFSLCTTKVWTLFPQAKEQVHVVERLALKLSVLLVSLPHLRRLMSS